MRISMLSILAALIVIPNTLLAQAFEVPPIGNIPEIANPAPTTWAMSGITIIHLSQSIGKRTPIMRTETWDARTVEILSRTQAPPLRKKDIRVLHTNGRYYIVVRRFILMRVTPQDARSERLSEAQLAQYWAKSVRNALPQVAPMPDRFGI